MSVKRTDNPKVVGVRLSADERALLDALHAMLNKSATRPVTRGEVVANALRALAKQKRLAAPS